ncbi:MAG TPA: hypothetical protein VM934_15255 [Pyrinomonadaceae bacterium]|jgi:hypothetical protein|nr:hypothetical protein [Pyrinomonadaceae bacterium]
MSKEKDYSGQEYVEGQEARDVPPMPGESGKQALSDTRIKQGAGSYAKVTMIGHYGGFCAQKQTLSFRDVTLKQARQLKWDYYGNCSVTMTCYDSQGNVVHEE